MVIVDEQGFIDEEKSDELLHVNIDGAVKQITPDKVTRIESAQSAEEAARALNVSVEELSQVIPDADTGLGVATAMEANGNMDGANAVRTYINATFGATSIIRKRQCPKYCVNEKTGSVN